ncbi:MAG: radical SAM protein [Bacteroidales bacterium]|nr:radical SAM protein [Bacteroidales bacterium]
MIKKSLMGLSAGEISALIEPEGFLLKHAVSVAQSIYKKGASDFELINKIPGKLKALLKANFTPGILQPAASELSADGTIKYLFRTPDGRAFESVFIPDKKRNTVCISTQSGCRMGCSFCLTAAYGFHGNLSAGEIVNQVLSIPEAGKVTHVVLMGMGEPMDNLDNVLKACEIMTAEWGLSLSPRNITVSTVGITHGIERFLADCECNLTLSLFSPFTDERKVMIPIETLYPVNSIIKLLRRYPLKKKRRISLAYMMIKDLNDTDRHLAELKAITSGSRIRVNLLPFHPASNGIKSLSSSERMMFFKHNLVISGISASIRKSRGADISAACGLLAAGLK